MKNVIWPILFLFLFKPFSTWASSVKKASTSSSIIAAKKIPASKSEVDEDDDDDDEDEACNCDCSAQSGDDDEALLPSTTLQTTDVDDDEDDNEDEVVEKSKNISANLKLVSDYISRGLTSSDHRPAIQGGFDWEHESGFFLGTWGSSVHFPDAESSLELDFYAGFSRTFFNNFESSLSLQRNTFYTNDGLNNWEILEKNVWKHFIFEVNFYPRWNGDGHIWYLSFGWEDQIASLFKLGLFAGYTMHSSQSIQTLVTEETVDQNDNQVEVQHLVTQRTPDYPDFRIVFSRDFSGLTFEASGILVKKQKVEGSEASSRLVIGVSKTF